MKTTKKLSIILITALVISILSVFTVSAADPDDVYTAPRLVYPVVADGIIGANEWDDAPELVITTQNEVFLAFGRYQGGDEDFFKNIKVTYKIKWDENNLYVLEVREDTDAWVYDNDDALAPWTGNGTLFFFSYDNNPMWANAYEIFWTAKSGDGNPKVALRAFLDGRDGSFESSDDAEWISNWKYGGSVTGTNSVFEIIVPWSDIQKFNADIGMNATMSGGEKFKFTPIIPKHTDDGSGQINYHDKYDRPDAVTDENSNPGELPVNWAPMVLGEAIVTIAEPETEPETTEAPPPAADEPAVADTPAPVPATPPEAPTTGDGGTLAYIFVALLAAAAVWGKKRINFNKF